VIPDKQKPSEEGSVCTRLTFGVSASTIVISATFQIISVITLNVSNDPGRCPVSSASIVAEHQRSNHVLPREDYSPTPDCLDLQENCGSLPGNNEYLTCLWLAGKVGEMNLTTGECYETGINV
jgi:hypothetical protein